MTDKVFEYRAMTAQGKLVSDRIAAGDRTAALRRLVQDGLVVTNIEEQPAVRANVLLLIRSKRLGSPERILILRQLALMVRAGVDLLESLQTIAVGMGGEGAERLNAVAAALRRGDGLGKAFEEHLPGYPVYVYALVQVGEASGALDRVLEDAAVQLANDDRVRREVNTALTYPAFLLTAGGAAVAFLFYEVVPRFARMLGEDAELSGLGGAVIGLGLFVRANGLLVLMTLVIAGFSLSAAVASPNGRQALYRVARATPVVGGIMRSRERAGFARILSFGLHNGVPILRAVELALAGLPSGPFRTALGNAARALRAGARVDEAFSDGGLLNSLDLSLLRAGQRSGALASMFGVVAQRYEDDFRDALKRSTALVEPAAIALVSIAVGAVALGLVTAMSSLYETVL